MIMGDIAHASKDQIRSVKVTLIDTHPNLILAPMEIIADLEKFGPYHGQIPLEFPGGKKSPAPQTRGGARGGFNKCSNTGPDIKAFKHLQTAIVRQAATLEDIYSFCLSSICPKEKTPAYILRK